LKAEELDKKFDSGEDITSHLDLMKARRPKQGVTPAAIREHYAFL